MEMKLYNEVKTMSKKFEGEIVQNTDHRVAIANTQPMANV
jgi:hypothetical protein